MSSPNSDIAMGVMAHAVLFIGPEVLYILSKSILDQH